METLNWKEIVKEYPLWIKQQNNKERSGHNSNIINILKALYNSNKILETKSEDEVYDQMFLITATGDDLDKIGEELGFRREVGQSDEDFRLLILMEETVKSFFGATTKALKEFIQLEGYTIQDDFRVYKDGYDPELGGNADGNTGNIMFTTSYSSHRNHIMFFEILESLSEADISYLENLVYMIGKVNNFVYVRNYAI